MPTEEEIKALQEKMKDMSPEELKELQKQQCIFCQIVDGKVASKKVYEDDKCLAVLDINPANPGHVLLMPKEHYPLMPLMPEDLIGHLFMVAKGLSRIMLTAVSAEGSDIFVANGSAAGQRAQHFMLHVIPRRPGDKVKMDIPINEFSKEKIDNAKKAVQEKVNAIFKQKKSVVEANPKAEAKEGKSPQTQDLQISSESQQAEISSEAETKPEEKSGEKKPAKKSKEEVNLDDIAELLK